MHEAGLSALILTKNEERDLPGCLRSISWCDDIHVLDSGSTDRTCDIARRFGANVAVKTYPESDALFGGDEAAHRNWSLRHTPFKHAWVLLLDADERVTPELARSVQSAVINPGDHVAFRIRRRDFYLDTWLKHVQISTLYLRLFKPAHVAYERLINPVSIADGPVASIPGYLDHFPFSKGIAHWFERHNAYSSLEAEQILQNRRAGTSFSLRKAFTSADVHERRFHQKELFYRLPCRPLAKFFIVYVIKRGFLDGRAGFQYALLQSLYEQMIVMKVDEAGSRIQDSRLRETHSRDSP
jgi:glycosyltransferase involved in cell wall biosynthesis